MDENCNTRRGKSLLRKIVHMGEEKKIMKNLQDGIIWGMEFFTTLIKKDDKKISF